MYDPLGTAQLCARPLDVSFPKQVAYDLLNVLFRNPTYLADHHQFFFRDGRNAGYFDDKKPIWNHRDEHARTDYMCTPDIYNERWLEQAINETPIKPYDQYSNTCQDWASEVLKRYEALVKKYTGPT